MPGDSPRSDDQNASDTSWVSHTTDQSPELTLTQIFTILADSRRRAILDCFRQLGESVERSDLVDHVLACEPTEAPDDHREQIVIDLHHNHLPRLTDLGLVEYDDRSTAVRYYGNPLLEAILEAAIETDEECDRE